MQAFVELLVAMLAVDRVGLEAVWWTAQPVAYGPLQGPAPMTSIIEACP